MPEFRYVALDAAGQPLRGTVEAANEAAVVEMLQRQGHIPMRAEPAGRGGFLADLMATRFTRRSALSAQDVSNVTRELATMLHAGQDLDRALRFVVETAPSARIRTILDRVRNKVRGGSPLATALSQEPDSFPRLYIGLVRAGEAGGSLGETLERLATLLERERSLVATVQSALIYPALLMVTATGSIVLLLTQVPPQFVPLFEQNGAEIPTPTRVLMALGDAVSVAGPWLLLLVLVGVLAFRQALRRPSFRERVDRLTLRLPVFGGLLRETLAARFCRTLGTLMRNGVPLIAALGITKEALGNLAAAHAVDRAGESARGGGGLSRPLGDAGIFPPRMIHLLRLGEETAQLAPMALRAADIHEERTRPTVQRLVSIMVPVITIVTGAAIAGIIAALMLAMLSLNDAVG